MAIERSRGDGKRAVEEVIRLRTTVEVFSTEVKECRHILSDLGSLAFDVANATAKLPGAQEKLRSAQRSLKIKERSLGVDAKQQLEHLKTSKFLEKRMNAMAVKTRLLTKLRARKFERDRVERTFRTQLNGNYCHYLLATIQVRIL